MKFGFGRCVGRFILPTQKGVNRMARKKVERNISYDEKRKKYCVNFDFGLDLETGSAALKPCIYGRNAYGKAS